MFGLTKEQELNICEQFMTSELSGKEIALNNKISVWQLWKICKHYKLPKKPNIAQYTTLCEIDHNFFELIDSPEKAYWLGFIAADGCIRLGLKSKTDQGLKVGLQIEDYDHIIKLQKTLKSNHQICINLKTESCHITFSSRKMCIDLEKLGFGENKTKNLKFPKFLSDYLLKFFVRGIVDGDGSWGLNEDSLRFRIANFSSEFLNDLQEFLIRMCKLKKTKISKCKKANCYSICYKGNRQTNIIHHFLNNGEGPFLERKRHFCFAYFDWYDKQQKTKTGKLIYKPDREKFKYNEPLSKINILELKHKIEIEKEELLKIKKEKLKNKKFYANINMEQELIKQKNIEKQIEINLAKPWDSSTGFIGLSKWFIKINNIRNS